MVSDPRWCSVGSSGSCGHLPDGCQEVYLAWFPIVLHIKGYEIHKEPRYGQLFANLFIC